MMSLTSFVPAAVPLELQSSTPWVPSSARKKSLPAKAKVVSSVGDESPPPGLMSLTSVVPAAVPSDFQSSVPCVAS
jgi:hypothetical protein